MAIRERSAVAVPKASLTFEAAQIRVDEMPEHDEFVFKLCPEDLLRTLEDLVLYALRATGVLAGTDA